MDDTFNRRQFLGLTGAGAALSLAGCSAPTPDSQAETDPDAVSEPTTVTLALSVDQEALDVKRSTLIEQLENETINQSEAQEELYATEAELLGEAAEAFRSNAEDAENLSVEESADQLGVLLVSGTPAALLGELETPTVRGIFPRSAFEDAKAQLEQQG